MILNLFKQEMMSNNKIISKIKALLSKTIENGASPEEQNSAQKKAEQLMLENFISEHQLKDEGFIKECKPCKVEIIKSAYDMSLFYNSLAKLFDCRAYYNSYYITFFGYEQDTELCAYFYSLVVSSCLEAKNNYLKSDHYKAAKKNYHAKTLAASFIKGYLITIKQRFKGMLLERNSNIEQVYGLVVADKISEVNNQFDKFKDFHIKKVYQKPISVEKEVFKEGLKSGLRLNLNGGLKSSESKRAITACGSITFLS